MAAKQENEILTIAAIRRPKGKQITEYLFNEKQQIFTFRSDTTTAQRSSSRLKEAFRKNMPVKARLDTRRGFIQRIHAPSPKEFAEFERARTFLDKPDRIRRIDVSSVDPITFNIVDYYLKVPSFKLCKKIFPNYKRAKKIFDFCAKQSCHLPGPYDISPCIPFQYVRDGCYARAHKMRWIITKKYHYCCEKVFSFANQNDDVLAVTADKWGGCCVTWWYHVAPLIRVRVKLAKISKLSVTIALVIDPSMFDKPVLLSSWLSAQEKTACNPNANVSMYSIQPGSAYSPANYAGTAFTTDSSYTATDSALIGYSNFVTCP
ncbi:MAG: protein-glutamine glutaminase family protein [Gammaproteobacteria bacterium]|nr:protein-glutamine glutaminase family protein [Gammaproteobacteria bacterium]